MFSLLTVLYLPTLLRIVEESNYLSKRGNVPVLFLTDHHGMKAYWGVEVYSPTHSLTSVLGGGEWSASRPWYPLDRLSGPGASLDAMVKRKIPSPCRDSNSDHPTRSPALYRWAIPACITWVGSPSVTQVLETTHRWFEPGISECESELYYYMTNLFITGT
jgi:hypothetical protein